MKEQKDTSFSEEERAAIDDFLGKVDPYKNAVMFGQALIQISQTFGKLNLPEIEEMLRKRESRTYLIALSTADMPEYTSKLPHSGKKEYPYYLWIGVNGEEEYRDKLEQEEITSQSNMEHLKETGMLVSRPGTNISRMTKSHLN